MNEDSKFVCEMNMLVCFFVGNLKPKHILFNRVKNSLHVIVQDG